MYEEWWQQHPDRFIPLGITYLADAEKAAAEIRRNAARGFVAVTLPERPHKHRVPVDLRRLVGSGHARVRRDRHRDLPARRLVGTRRCRARRARPGRRRRCSGSSRSRRARSGCGRAGRSGIPDLKIAMSEGGLGWVAMLLDRLDFMADRGEYLSNGYWPDGTSCSIATGSTGTTPRRGISMSQRG